MIFSFLMFAISVASVVGSAFMYKKMGLPWWMIFIPIYPNWKMFEVLYGPGKGVECLKMLIPVYGIFIMYKFYFELGRQFGQDEDFCIWMIIAAPIMFCILGFDNNIQFVGIDIYDESDSTGMYSSDSY